MKLVILSILLATALLAITTPNSWAVVSDSLKSIIQADWPAIIQKIKQSTNENLSSVDEYSISVFANTSKLKDLSISQYQNQSVIPIVVNGNIVDDNEVPPQPPLLEICGDGIDNDNDNLVDEGCPINPPEGPEDSPVINVNDSKWLRVSAIGDIDNNNGLVTQLNLAKKYNTQVLIIPGDYCYDSCAQVIAKLKTAGFDSKNTAIILGNHDSKSETNAFNGRSITYGTWNLASKLGIFGIDANTAFTCDSTQFKALKDQMDSSDAWYNIPVVHQPFVTVKSDHGPNGQFSCWDPLFRGNSASLVLQAHNHNYQRITVNGMPYLVVGTGTHDSGSSMYPIGSSSWNGFSCDKCLTKINGITMIDFQIDDPAQRHYQGWFLSNSEKVEDKFSR